MTTDSPTWGVVVGTNETTAWLLPFWWHWYSLHNDLPVAFIDFGLQPESLAFCKSKGTVIQPSSFFSIAQKQEVDTSLQENWENQYGNSVWQARMGWFYKPLAMQHSPFSTSIWLDLDCEVCGCLLPLFSLLTTQLAIAADPERVGIYNSGVVVFQKNAPLIDLWAQACREENHRFIGDDLLLPPLLEKHQGQWQELPPYYHRLAGMGFDPPFLILHFASNWGKLWIETQGGYQALKNRLLTNTIPR